MKINTFMIFILLSTSSSHLMATSIIKGDVKLIYSRELSNSYNKQRPFITEEQVKWLQKRKRLVLAMPIINSPPMSLLRRDRFYEGVTADIVGLVADSLGVEIVVQEFLSYEDAIKAVKNGVADFIGEANVYDINQGLALTTPYISDGAGIYTRFGVKRGDINTVAIVENYLPLSEVIRYIPRSKVIFYSSRKAAIASVAYGKTDAALVDLVSGNYIANSYYPDIIKLGYPINSSSAGFSFGVSKDNLLLRGILNSALDAISSESVNNILRRWNGGGVSLKLEKLKLNQDEWALIHGNKDITIAVQTNIPPLSYIDKQGSLHGLVIDLLQVIETRLGINFTILPVKNTKEQIAAVESGVADLMIMSPTEERKKNYTFTSAFVMEPLVYILHKKNHDVDPYSLVRSGRVATINDFISTIKIGELFHLAGSTSFSQISDALDCVANEQCDVVILPLRTARFLIGTKYSDSLFISGDAFDSQPVEVSFAAKFSHEKLVLIMDKALISIPPDEMARLATHWRVNAKSEVITILDFLNEFKEIIISILFAFLLSIILVGALWFQIKKRKKVEIELETQLKFMEELIESTPHPIYALDMAGSHVLCNGSYASFFGMDKFDVIGTKLSMLVNRYAHMSDAKDIIDKTLNDNKPRSSDLCFSLPNGEVYIYYWTYPYKDYLGKQQGCVGGWIDISDRIELLSQLTEARNNAVEASKAKSTFLSIMSHEIRTPMNAIIGMLELTLRKNNLDDGDEKAIVMAYQAAKDLLGLLGDILDISKIESGKLGVEPSPHYLLGLTTQVVDIFRVSAVEKGLGLNLNLKDDAMVMVDPTRYKQIISNLLSNAIKFSHSGCVDLSISLKSIKDLCEVYIQVTDSGIGICQEDIDKLFEPFNQGNQPADMKPNGAGLGLYISRTLCQLMGGDLILESQPGIGTTVTALLRLSLLDAMYDNAVGAQEKINDIYDSNTAKYKILVVDDHPVNCILVCQQLQFLGHDVETALSGREALSKLEKQTFHFIITDFNMPEMDGLVFAKLCKELESSSVIIGLTADARQLKIEDAIQAGMDDCLLKPIGIDQLACCISMHSVMVNNVSPIEIANAIKYELGDVISDGDVIQSLLVNFIHTSNEEIKSLYMASERKDCKAFLNSLSRLRDLSKNIGAEALAQCCSEWGHSQRLTWCMLSALRQIQSKYLDVQTAVCILLDNE